MYMSNIILQTSLPLINTTNFINDFLDTLLEEYCSQHYQENTVIGKGIQLPTLVTLLRYKYPNYKLISPGVLGHIYTTEIKVIYEDKYHDQLVNALNHKLSILFTHYIPKDIFNISFEIISNVFQSITSKLYSYDFYQDLNLNSLVREYTKQDVYIEYSKWSLTVYLGLSKIHSFVTIYKPTIETLKEINKTFLRKNEESLNNLDFNSFNIKVFIISLYITLSSKKELEDFTHNITSDYFKFFFNKCSDYLIKFDVEIKEYIQNNFKFENKPIEKIKETVGLLDELSNQSTVTVETIIEDKKEIEDQSHLDLTSKELFWLRIIVSILVLFSLYFIFK